MSSAMVELIHEINALLKEGEGLQLSKRPKDENLGDLAVAYESWYTRASAVVAQIAPDRLNDFRDCYRLDRRKDITYLTYTIGDYLLALRVTSGLSEVNSSSAYSSKLVRQLSILGSVGDLIRSTLRDIRTVLRAELFDSDMAVAREMLKEKHLRCAGVIAGVVLESHLASVAERREVKVTKKKPMLKDWNDALKSANAYDIPTWRNIQFLADIRNLCAHNEEPTADQVKDLLDGTEKIIKQVF